MMRKVAAVLLAACLVTGALPGAAAVPEGARMVEGGQRVRGNVVPLDGGGWIVSGRGQRPAGARWYERPEAPVRVDDYGEIGEGFVARLDADGEALWDIRLGDNSAQNTMYARGFFPDGRLLALFQTNPLEGSGMGSQLFVVNMESGHVDGMLPSAVLEAMGPLSSVAVLPDGYLVGGRVPVQMQYFRGRSASEPVAGVVLRRLDARYRERWALDLGVFAERPAFQTLLLADGGIVLLGQQEEAGGVAPGLRLTRIEADQVLRSSQVWTAPIRAAGGGYAVGMARLGDGYALAVTGAETRVLDVLYISGAGGVLGTLAVIGPQEDAEETSAGFTLKASPDGTRVTLSGTLFAKDAGSVSGTRVRGIWYMDITEDMFESKEGV